MDDFYKTCRWCRWNKNGECQHSGTFCRGLPKSGVQIR